MFYLLIPWDDIDYWQAFFACNVVVDNAERFFGIIVVMCAGKGWL